MPMMTFFGTHLMTRCGNMFASIVTRSAFSAVFFGRFSLTPFLRMRSVAMPVPVKPNEYRALTIARNVNFCDFFKNRLFFSAYLLSYIFFA
jgi:hypothetical protein